MTKTPIFLFHLFLFFLASAQNDVYIVHMDKTSMPKAFAAQHSWYISTLDSIQVHSSKLVYSYNNAMNGFSAVLSNLELEDLKNTIGFVSAFKDSAVELDTTHSAQFLGLDSKFGLLAESNLGHDIIIGVVDTGVWPESGSFSDEGMGEIPSRWRGECEVGSSFNSSLCNKKLIGARFFNKGLMANIPNVTISMNSTRDTGGHGTHTSSTAAGNYVEGASFFGYAAGTARGIAPRAHVAMYKCLWDEGGFSSDIIAAIEQAIIDGVDVLSISLGLSGVPLYEDPIAIATFAALNAGVFVSTSAGNHGPSFSTLHNGIPWVLTVAAGTVNREFTGILTLADGNSLTGLSLYPGNYSSPQLLPLVFSGSCDNLSELEKIGNKIVVCEDKNGSMSDQVTYVEFAKVGAGIFISNITDLEFYQLSSFPALFVDQESGKKIKDYIKKSEAEPKGSLEFKQTQIGKKLAPQVASYSSRGPSPSCPFVLKPDIMAPGVLILASWPDNIPVAAIGTKNAFSKFNLISGTSMSCPHAAGIAALLKAAHPEWGSAAIRSAMMTTVDSTDNTGDSIKDIGDNYNSATPLAMGAGHINPNRALDPGLIYNTTTEEYLNLLCSLNFTANQMKTITGSSSLKCESPSLDLNYPSIIAFFNVNGSNNDSNIVKEFNRRVTNVGEKTATYVSKVTPVEGFQIKVEPEKLVFRDKYEELSFKVSIEGPSLMKEDIAFGYLVWEDIDAKYVVKSPIIATSFSSKVL